MLYEEERVQEAIKEVVRDKIQTRHQRIRIKKEGHGIDGIVHEFEVEDGEHEYLKHHR